jgi:hypothetical protein
MQERSYWPVWVQFLHRWGMEGTASALLEAAAPLAVVLAQVVYAGGPLVGKQQQWHALAQMLEDPQGSRSFIDYLRQEGIA